MKHTWLYILTLLCAGSLSGQMTISTPTLTNAVTIDGIIVGNEWSDASVTNSIAKLVFGSTSGASDMTATIRLKWDATNFYALVQVTDDARNVDSSNNDPAIINSFHDDSVEIYLDMDHLGTAGAPTEPLSTANRIYQYRFGLENSEIETVELTNPTTNFAFAHADTGSNYVMEIEMPWSTLGGLSPTIGAVYGFEAGINDDDDGGDRDAQFFWNAALASAWNDAGQWGDIQLAAAIPEPSTVSLLFGMSGLVGWIVFKKRKKVVA